MFGVQDNTENSLLSDLKRTGKEKESGVPGKEVDSLYYSLNVLFICYIHSRSTKTFVDVNDRILGVEHSWLRFIP